MKYLDKTGLETYTKAILTKIKGDYDTLGTKVDTLSSSSLTRSIVETLPEVSAAASNTIYMVANRETEGDIYDEYLFTNGAFEKIGSTAVDLSGYLQVKEVDIGSDIIFYPSEWVEDEYNYNKNDSEMVSNFLTSFSEISQGDYITFKQKVGTNETSSMTPPIYVTSLQRNLDNNVGSVILTSSIGEQLFCMYNSSIIKYQILYFGIGSGLTSDGTTISLDTSVIPTTLPASDVYDWAKAETKPTYTAAEVGALSSDTTIPSKISDLTNDSDFLTEQSLNGYAKTTDIKTYTAGTGINISDTNEISVDTSALPSGSEGTDEVYIGNITPTDGQEIWIDTSDDTGAESEEETYLTSADLAPYALKTELFSKSYNDLTDKPTLFSGSYNDLSDKPTQVAISTSISAASTDSNAVTPKAVYDYVQTAITSLPTVYVGDTTPDSTFGNNGDIYLIVEG